MTVPWSGGVGRRIWRGSLCPLTEPPSSPPPWMELKRSVFLYHVLVKEGFEILVLLRAPIRRGKFACLSLYWASDNLRLALEADCFSFCGGLYPGEDFV